MKFEWSNTTRVIFGVGEFSRLGDEASKIGKHTLIVTGKSSTKRTGVLEKAISMLNDSGVETTVFDEIEPNPRASTVDRAAAVANSNGCDFVIGIGGGSSMDACKTIAVVAAGGGKCWDYVKDGTDKKLREAVAALPIVTVPTLAATGSEANGGAVITNWDTYEKSVFIHKLQYPRFSIVDPELTVTVNRDYTADGGIDIISHVIESYFSCTDYTPVQDRFSEGVIRTVMEHLPRAMNDGSDLEARTQLSWCSTVALSGMVNAGRVGGFPLHAMEHSLSGHYDISHGRGLSILMPHLMRYTAEVSPDKYAQFARNIFLIDIDSMSVQDAAAAAVDKFEAWMKETGVYHRLSEVGIDSKKFDVMAEDTVRIYGNGKDHIPNARPLKKEDIVVIYEMAA
jgi:alcohol dehydrogenase YqhD (iron-dependent ADH family)